MPAEIEPKQSPRALAFELWMKAPMPMVTFFKTLNVSRLVRLARKRGIKFNLLMCWCIGKAAQTEEFYVLPVGGKLLRYDRIAVNIIVATKDGEIAGCDVPYSASFNVFARDYTELTESVRNTSRAHELDADHMVIGTSAITAYEIDGAVNVYAGIYNNPFLLWGKYRRKFLRTILPVSFQFHHTQMDGVPAARFLDRLQKEIDAIRL